MRPIFIKFFSIKQYVVLCFTKVLISDLFFSFFFFRKNSNKESDLSEDDIRTVRASLYGLVKYYISKGMSHPEMLSILGYIAAIGDEDQVRII